MCIDHKPTGQLAIGLLGWIADARRKQALLLCRSAARRTPSEDAVRELLENLREAHQRAVEIAGAKKAGQVSYILPILGSILAIFLLDETFQMYHAIGFMLILLGVYFGSKGEQIN